MKQALQLTQKQKKQIVSENNDCRNAGGLHDPKKHRFLTSASAITSLRPIYTEKRVQPDPLEQTAQIGLTVIVEATSAGKTET